MKLLLFSDLHCDTAAARNLVALSAKTDIAIGAGDFANGRQRLALTLDILRDLSCPAVYVPGNNESLEELTEACRDHPRTHVLHGTGITLNGLDIFGLGGAVPVTPFGSWSYDFSEEQAAELLRDFPAGGILVSHSPPFGLLDMASNGKHLGSQAVRKIVDERLPRLVVCGHIHASGGKQFQNGPTLVVNAGPAGMMVEMTGWNDQLGMTNDQ
ncbi:metallophosphoesterase family protein [Zavarzinella formosa]|uniref:metallophosphoesterase family protein n=1 Tax=Zavarzinella formosa TaxID=360055 RepID=UPI00031881B8|nr:metallophosphoesterase family protein [Zavarzinella formosa]